MTRLLFYLSITCFLGTVYCKDLCLLSPFKLEYKYFTGAEGDTLVWDDNSAESWDYVSSNSGARIGVHFMTPYDPSTSSCIIRGGLFYLFNSSGSAQHIRFSVHKNGKDNLPVDTYLEIKDFTMSDTPVSPVWVSIDFSDAKVTDSDTQVFWLVYWYGSNTTEPRFGKDNHLGDLAREHYAFRDDSSSWRRSTTAKSMPMFRAIVAEGPAGFEKHDQFETSLPVKTQFCLNSPNPFRDKTRISFCIGNDYRGKEVELIAYDILGKRRAVLSKGSYLNGIQRVTWNGTDEKGARLQAGVYILRLVHKGVTIATTKTVMLR